MIQSFEGWIATILRRLFLAGHIVPGGRNRPGAVIQGSDLNGLKLYLLHLWNATTCVKQQTAFAMVVKFI